MMRAIFIVLGVFLSASLAVTSFSLGQSYEISLENLQNNETVEIEYSSQGCFHSDQAKFIINNQQVTRVSHGNRWAAAEDEVQTLLTRELTLVQLQGFEKYLARISSVTRGGCTTQINLKLTMKRNGETILTRTLKDGSCAQVAGEYTLSELNYDFGQQNSAMGDQQ